MEQTVALAKLRVKGRVQGVFYRQTTKEKARELGIKGWVANVVDGSVAIEALGYGPALEELISWCRQGPPSAKVDSVEVQWVEEIIDPAQVSGFEIRADIDAR